MADLYTHTKKLTPNEHTDTDTHSNLNIHKPVVCSCVPGSVDQMIQTEFKGPAAIHCEV